MEAFQAWWNTLDTIRQILYCIAIPTSLLIVIQTIMLTSGATNANAGSDISDVSGLSPHGDTGHYAANNLDTSADGVAHGDFTVMSIFSIQGVMAFFCIFGWTGIVMLSCGASVVSALFLAFIFGAGAMFGVAAILRSASKLVQNGTVQLARLVGATGKVYLSIPEGGLGKVMLHTSERMLELDAVSEGGEEIPTNYLVKVVSLRDNVLVVAKN